MNLRKHTILYIDDEYNNLVVFKSSFFKEYNILTAQSGAEGLKILEEKEVHLIITDQRMPEMTGIEFLERVVKRYPDPVRIILTAYADVDIILDAINKCGIYHYILKPWDKRDLKLRLDNALHKFDLEIENKRLIQDLKIANEQLEDKVRERTKELKQANEDLKKLNAIKDKLFSIISHDLKVPLVSLNVLLEVMGRLQDDLSIEKFKGYSLKVQSYIKNVMDLMENLLSWSLAQMNQLHIELADVDLSTVIKRNYELFRFIADQKAIELDLKPLPENTLVKADSNMLDTIVRNLLSNAIKYTDRDGNVNIRNELNENSVKLIIEDTGIGIEQDKIPDIFSPDNFFTSMGTLNEKGVGLGLKLCKDFTDKQGGTLEVESEPGKGSRFSLTMPRAS